MSKNKIYFLIFLIIAITAIAAVFWYAKDLGGFKNTIGEKMNLGRTESADQHETTASPETPNEEPAAPSGSGSEPKEEDAPEIVSAYVTPQSLEFEYKTGNTYCPRKMGIIQIGKTGRGEAADWVIPHPTPKWLDLKPSGSLGENVPVYFTCVLDKERPQTLSADINFVLVNQLGKQISEPVILKITGHITK